MSFSPIFLSNLKCLAFKTTEQPIVKNVKQFEYSGTMQREMTTTTQLQQEFYLLHKVF